MSTSTHSPRVKICCIASIDEARLAVDAGANAIGLVSRMPSGPGPISISQIRSIIDGVGDLLRQRQVDSFLLTCETTADAIVDQLRATGCNTVQLCDALANEADYAAIRAGAPGVRVVQVIHIENEVSLDEAFRAQQHADALLLDSGRPGAAIKELGGTGRAHDWTLSRRIVGTSTVPVWLAGGLNAGNVGQAVRDVGAYGLDVCSGVRTNGALDAQKLQAFIAAARSC
jgi:phosphoribosylanthranilate isomerase